MSFVYPAFLWALAALSIPIIIHLFNFRRYKTVYFPDISFLKEVKQETDSRSKIKHWLVLLMRLLAISFLVFAFAQPFIKHQTQIERAGKKSISIYIDNSYSMQGTNSNVPLIELAKKKSYEILNAYEPDDEFQILSNEFEGKQQRFVNREQAKDLIDEVKPSAQLRLLSDVIQRQNELMKQSTTSSRFIYEISDFQKSSTDFNASRTDSLNRYYFISLSANTRNNIAIDSAWLKNPIVLNNQEQELYIKIHNYGTEELKNVRLQLDINKLTKGITSFDLPAQNSIIDTIKFTPQTAGWSSCLLSVSDFPVVYDDKYYFTFNAIDKISVMQIYSNSPNPFLEALLKDNKNFNYSAFNINQVPYNDLKNNLLIILNEATDISSGLSEVLVKYIQEGGNVLVIPNKDCKVESYNSFLQAVNADKMIAWNSIDWQADNINVAQGLFADVFEKMPENMKLPKGNGLFAFSQFSVSKAEPIIQLNNKMPLITKYKYERGALFISSVPFKKELNDFAVNVIFPPMIFKMAINKSYKDAIAYSIGNDNVISIPFSDTEQESLIKMKSDAGEFIPAQRSIGNNTIINTGKELMNAGVYNFISGNTALNYAAAFNFNRIESDLNCYSSDELKAESAKLKIDLFANDKEDLSQAINIYNAGTPLWKYCIMLVLLFIVLEILLLKYWK